MLMFFYNVMWRLCWSDILNVMSAMNSMLMSESVGVPLDQCHNYDYDVT